MMEVHFPNKMRKKSSILKGIYKTPKVRNSLEASDK